MYPNLQTELENFANQQQPVTRNGFIPRSAQVTKNFLGKTHVDKLLKSETYVVSEKCKIKGLAILAVLLLIFLISVFGVAVMWFSNGFYDLIYQKIVRTEGSPAFEMWRKPTVSPFINIYIFNYTNVERFEAGIDDKLHVEEKGPYVYREKMERVNININGSYISYQNQRSYYFVPERSNGRPSDVFVVPNMLLLAVAALHRFSNFFTRLTISGALKGLYPNPFMTLSAEKFIKGYDDPLYSLWGSLKRFQNEHAAENLGMLTQKMGLHPDVYTIHSGLNDIDQIGKIKSINGKSSLDYWNTDECNGIDATDGSIFSPLAVSQKKPVRAFYKEMCRTIQLNFTREDSIFDGAIPTYRYEAEESMFDSPDNYPKNQCFCDSEGGTCAPQGLFNTTACALGAPMFVSYPHFYRGDPKLVNSLSGLRPDQAKHEMYFHLHPKMGFPMHGKSRLQVNMQLLKTFGFSQFDDYEDGLVLPLVWFEIGVVDKDLPLEVKGKIEMATHTVAAVETFLKYGFVFVALILMIPIAANLQYRFRQKRGVVVTIPEIQQKPLGPW